MHGGQREVEGQEARWTRRSGDPELRADAGVDLDRGVGGDPGGVDDRHGGIADGTAPQQLSRHQRGGVGSDELALGGDGGGGVEHAHDEHALAAVGEEPLYGVGKETVLAAVKMAEESPELPVEELHDYVYFNGAQS